MQLRAAEREGRAFATTADASMRYARRMAFLGWRMDERADDATELRERMVAEQLLPRGVRDPRVLAAMRAVPRHLFLRRAGRIPRRGAAREHFLATAYDDGPLSIGHGQTISQPFMVGWMSAALELEGDERVLEVGAGCGYQTAVLALLAREIHAVEIVPELAALARANLAELRVRNAVVQEGDGYDGLPALAPFDAILVAAAPDHVPPPLLAQLAVGGRMVIPVGEDEQELLVVRRTARGYEERHDFGVRFVPLVRRAEVRGGGSGGGAPAP